MWGLVEAFPKVPLLVMAVHWWVGAAVLQSVWRQWRRLLTMLHRPCI